MPSRKTKKNSYHKNRKPTKAATAQNARQVRIKHRHINTTSFPKQGQLRANKASPKEESELSSFVSPVRDLGFNAATFQPLRRLLEPDSLDDIIGTRRHRNNFQLQPTTETTTEKEICNKIEQSYIGMSYDEMYLPIDAFERIFTMDSIVALVQGKYSEATDAQLKTKINEITCRRRILGILLCMGKFEWMETFILADILDDHLPFQFQHSIILTRQSDQLNVAMLPNWTRNDLFLFQIYQSVFFVPFFAIQDDPHYYVLDKSIRLPWLRSREIRNGIYKVEVHPGHHNFKSNQVPDRPLCFALKEFFPSASNTFHQELLALKKACAEIHKEKHLIKLLLAFQHGQKYYFLFEWANGNLEEYWRTYREPPEHTAAKQKWVVQQCLGLATAVKRIHGLATWQIQARRNSTAPKIGVADGIVRDWGRHGDIKPQNILWFSAYNDDTDLLVLSDLGLTRYHSRVTQSMVEDVDGYTWLYRAPEVDLPNQFVSPKYDIWSLGCVFLEFCIWWLEGYDAYQKFYYDRCGEDQCSGIIQEDNYYIVTESDGRLEAKVKSVVSDWIKRLRKEYAADIFAQGMLDLVENRMLVVNKKQRYSADLICTELDLISRQINKERTDGIKQTQARAAN